MAVNFAVPETPLKYSNPPIYQWQDRGRPYHTPTRWFVPSKWTARTPGIPVMITALAATTPHFQIRALTITVFLGSGDVQVGEQSVFDHPEVERLYRQVAFSPRPYSTCQGDCYVVGLVDVSHSGLLLHHSTFRGHAEDMKRWDSAKCVVDHGVDTASLVCPYSGRLAYVCENGHGDGYNRVHIVDILGP